MDANWITVREAAELEQVSRREIELRMKPGDKQFIASRRRGEIETKADSSARPGGPRNDNNKSPRPGRRGRLINLATLSFDAQRRWRDRQSPSTPTNSQSRETQSGAQPQDHSRPDSATAAPAPEAGSGAQAAAQREFFPQDSIELAVRELRAKLQHDEARYNVILLRYKAIAPTFNHDYAAIHGAPTIGKYFEEVAPRVGQGVHLSTLWRWRKDFNDPFQAGKPLEALLALGDARPGPPPGTGTILTPDMKLRIQDRWEGLSGIRLTRSQIVRDVVEYIREKQRALGAAYAYSLPNDPNNPKDPYRSAVLRYINGELQGDRNPRRNGPEAIKCAAGYIDRHYDDESAGDAWCIDEWEIDAVFYNAENHRQLINYGAGNPIAHILTIADERTTSILNWTVTLELERATLDLAEELLRRNWLPRRLVSDRAKRFRQLVRGRVVVGTRGELLKKLEGPLGLLGVQPRGSEEKNPRANRLERLHLLYACRAREFGRSWKGANTVEREQTEIDARVARHLREHCKYGTAPAELMSIQEAVGIVRRWVEEINLAETEAKGCKGLTRLAAFRQFQPSAEEIARRRLPQEVIDLAFAEHYEATVQPGGLIELNDGKRYSSRELSEHAGEVLPIIRYRRDRSRIIVAFDDGAPAQAEERIPVGTQDPEGLAREIAKLQHARKLIAPEDPQDGAGSEKQIPLPPGRDRNDNAAGESPRQLAEISSSEWITESLRRRAIPPTPRSLTSEEVALAALEMEARK